MLSDLNGMRSENTRFPVKLLFSGNWLPIQHNRTILTQEVLISEVNLSCYKMVTFLQVLYHKL